MLRALRYVSNHIGKSPGLKSSEGFDSKVNLATNVPYGADWANNCMYYVYGKLLGAGFREVSYIFVR
jgi:hypothetical protein